MKWFYNKAYWFKLWKTSYIYRIKLFYKFAFRPGSPFGLFPIKEYKGQYIYLDYIEKDNRPLQIRVALPGGTFSQEIDIEKLIESAERFIDQ